MLVPPAWWPAAFNTTSSRSTPRRTREGQQDAYAQQQAAAPPPAPAPAEPDLNAQLTQLAALHQQGILTDEEFSAKKAQLLGI